MSEPAPILIPGGTCELSEADGQRLQAFAEIAEKQLREQLVKNGFQEIGCAIVLWHRNAVGVTYATNKWLTREFAIAVKVLHDHFRAPKVGG